MYINSMNVECKSLNTIFHSLNVYMYIVSCYCVSISIALCICMFMFFVRRPTSGPRAVRDPR